MMNNHWLIIITSAYLKYLEGGNTIRLDGRLFNT